MGKAEVLSLLRDGEYVSGEEISRTLGVTRAAVWKAVQALRADGCSIDSVPNRGYCLHRPESALSDAAVHALLEDCPWPINVLPTVDSTNTYAKAQAALGAPHGSVYVTGRQTGGPSPWPSAAPSGTAARPMSASNGRTIWSSARERSAAS